MDTWGNKGGGNADVSAPLAAYAKAFCRQEAARQRLNDSISLIQHVATLLMNPEGVHFANVGFAQPPGPHYVIDGHTWPSSVELAAILSEWKTAREAAHRAWSTLPEDERRRAREPRS